MSHSYLTHLVFLRCFTHYTEIFLQFIPIFLNYSLSYDGSIMTADATTEIENDLPTTETVQANSGVKTLPLHNNEIGRQSGKLNNYPSV